MKVLVVTVAGHGVDLNDINDTHPRKICPMGIWNHIGIQKVDLVITLSKEMILLTQDPVAV